MDDVRKKKQNEVNETPIGTTIRFFDKEILAGLRRTFDEETFNDVAKKEWTFYLPKRSKQVLKIDFGQYYEFEGGKTAIKKELTESSVRGAAWEPPQQMGTKLLYYCPLPSWKDRSG